ncbi:hypothetical protein CUN85_11290 [Methanolobus halotolerans]|uniref:Uncharacterized protein n=1 Tax=Methanolobus halotolerans TaxID=2052935 RepID=A0A4E0Q2V8_9EURY|nr:hypothetical protein CUN85_11290 [Methanolobus halotolerans]
MYGRILLASESFITILLISYLIPVVLRKKEQGDIPYRMEVHFGRFHINDLGYTVDSCDDIWFIE